jgi:hypothetical protein
VLGVKGVEDPVGEGTLRGGLGEHEDGETFYSVAGVARP